ncbi:MAG: chorismate synthase [Candidatus Delongbacteria bacterium]|nr:chorismate synthase [Candidatus Delongbacteria bacterium]
MNSFGTIFRIHIYGESHGPCVGVIIDGCPAGISLKTGDLISDLNRRKPLSKGTTERKESDIPNIKSGVFKGKTTGSPILIEFANENIRSRDYEKFRSVPRPGQADFSAGVKFGGFNDLRGGGHFSARLTLGLVAAGVIAKKILKGVKFSSDLVRAGGSAEINRSVLKAVKESDSIGGVIECRIDGLPAGVGEPFFNSLESAISHIVFSIPSVKGVEFGKGFASADMKGSEYNDRLVDVSGVTATNSCGGVTAGLSNGNRVFFRTAMRPPSSISKPQEALNLQTGKSEILAITGRHDVCPALRSSVIIEAAAAIAICDLYLINKCMTIKKKD